MIASLHVLPRLSSSQPPSFTDTSSHSTSKGLSDSFFYCTWIAFGRGILNTIREMDKAGGKKICKSSSSCNPGMMTRGTKERWSREAAPLKTAMSWRTFQIIPVSQNNTMTHKYHPTSERTKVNIRYKALNIASPTHFLFILHTWLTPSFIYFSFFCKI